MTATRPTAPVVRTMSAEECVARLATATVARIGYVSAQGLQIIPVSYRATAGPIMLSTTPNSSLSQLAERGAALTLEVDEHDDSAELVWSVMAHGTVSKVHPTGTAHTVVLTPVNSWPGGQFAEALRFTPASYSGRVLQHPASAAPSADPPAPTAPAGAAPPHPTPGLTETTP